MKDKVKESEARYRGLADSLPQTVAEFDEQGNFTFINLNGFEAFGYKKDDFGRGLNIIQMIVPEDRDRGRVNIQKLVTGETKVSSNEYTALRKDGSTFPIAVYAMPVIAEGKSARLRVIVIDITERKRSEEMLRESEARLRQVIDLVPHFIFAKDRNGRFILVNKAVADNYGTTVEELTGKTDADFNPNRNEVEHFLKDDLQVIDGGRPKEIPEEKITDSKGNVRILQTTKIPFTLSLSGVDALLGVSTDITERKLSEKALQKSEGKYRNIFENAVEGIFQTALEGQLLTANPSLARMLGYDSPQDMMASINDVGEQLYVHPEDRMRFRTVLSHHGYVEGFEMQLCRKDGKTIWTSMHARAVYDEDGKIACIEGTIENITKRKNAEQALFESEGKYRRVVETTLVSLYIIQDYSFRFVNQKFCNLSGYTYDEIVDTLKPLSVIHPDDRKRVREISEKLLSGKIDYIEYEHKAIRKDGNVITIKVFGSSITYNGRIAISGTCIDVTREKSLESQLRQVQKVEAIGTLAGGIAHDFNNILTVITGYGTLLQMKVDTADPLRVYVDNILSASQKASSLTQNLLTFGRQQPITLKPIDINKIIQGTEKLLKRLLFEDITLETHLTSDNIIVMADATHIDQILFNLVTNARDAMPKGGRLSIETKLLVLEASFIQIHGFGEPGRYALLSISDTGVGMDETTKGKIFDPFFTTKEMGKGTGLGLSTVYGIVKQHNGYITVYSEPNTGTTFHMYFPVVKATVDEEKDASWDIRKGKETVLVAEDNEDVRRFVKDILGQYGYTVIEAVDGDDAIDKFNKHKTIDMVILDTVMPKKNGKEVYDRIKRERPDVKVLFTSGYTKDIVLDKGIHDKDFAFIAKPLSPNELLQKVREMLDK